MDLIQQLETLDIDWSQASLFTCDAVSMYTNTDTDHLLEIIPPFIHHHCDSPTLVDVIIVAHKITMQYNYIKFEDTYWLQISGTSMGVPPASPYAYIYFGIHEIEIINEFPQHLPFYLCYIDYDKEVWCHHPNATYDHVLWIHFQCHMNCFGFLTWNFSPLSKCITFMDLDISIT